MSSVNFLTPIATVIILAVIQTVEILFGLMIAIATLAVAARKLGIAYPIPFVIGGLVLGMIPGLPQVHLNPDLVFLIFLPPLIYPAALFTSWRDFRANLRPISMLAIRLVIISTVVIGFVAHKLVGLPWAAAFVLGAIVSPPDAVAATAITKRRSQRSCKRSVSLCRDCVFFAEFFLCVLDWFFENGLGSVVG